MAEAAQAFSALGAPLNLVVNETTWHHGYVQPNREALYSFFCSHLAAATPHPNCSHAAEFAIPEFSHEQLWATTTGQVRHVLGTTPLSLPFLMPWPHKARPDGLNSIS